MANEFDTKGWPQRIHRPLGQPRQFNPYVKERSLIQEDDETIYYPLVYGDENKLKVVVNPGYGRTKTTRVTRKADYCPKTNKKLDFNDKQFEIFDEGCYEVLQYKPHSTPRLKNQQFNNFGNRSEIPAPVVSQSTVRALNNDFYKTNDRRVLTTLQHNNNHVYTQQPDKKTCVHSQYNESSNVSQNNETLLDYCTCMCCVKAAFYHMTKDSDNEGHIADQPCACNGPITQCLPRWLCLGFFALCLPCLCCYPPLKACGKLKQTCSKATQHTKK